MSTLDAIADASGPAATARRLTPLLACAALLALVAVVYSSVGSFGFVDFDDSRYVFDNPVVRRGLTPDGIAWAFTTLHGSNWHPVTWLSHMLDVTVFGAEPGWLHRMNVVWHAANTLLLFAVLRSATGALGRSALVAALFAVHPLNVESVAWIAERKNLVSTFFWLVAMGAHVRYARRPSVGRYLLVALAFVLGLLSKPMVVTLPIVLLLLDVSPLGRLGTGAALRPTAVRLVAEKAPLLLLAAASSAITIVAQAHGGAVSSVDALSVPVRIAHAAIAYVWYLGKAVWPSKLAVFYAHPAWSPAGLSPWKVGVAAVLLAAATALALCVRRSHPLVTVGWLWYLVTLVPVIGVVQVGLQGTADRYAYVPLIGIFIAVAWGFPQPSPAGPWRRVPALAGAGLVLALAGVARAETGAWRDSFTLFSRAASRDPDNWLAWKNVGMYRFQRDEFREAAEAFRQSLRTRPGDPDTWSNLALSHAALGEHAVVVGYLERSLRLRPDDADTWLNLGIAYALTGRPDLAAGAARRLREIDPAKASLLLERLAGLGAAPNAAPR